jgi:hypothetical protein
MLITKMNLYTTDAYDKMDGDCYGKLLPNIPPQSVIAVNNASYCSREKEQLLTKSQEKDKM